MFISYLRLLRRLIRMSVNYVDDLVVNISNNGMTKDLWDLVNTDLYKLRSMNIKSDKERNLFFYIENFIEDLLDEFNVNVDNLDKIIRSVFQYLRSYNNVNLTDIRHAVLLSLYKHNKLAYPNIQGIGAGNMQPQRDISKWIQTLNEIYTYPNKYVAITKLTEGWDPMEKLNFLSWIRYYENGDHEKYQLKKAGELYTQLDNEEIKGPGRPRKTRKTLEQTKISLINRLDSATRLLREFATVWPQNIWNRLAEALSDLKREIIPMRTVATINDCIIRTSYTWDNFGFSEGAELLRKIAQTPGEEDVTTQIEKALTGKEYKTEPERKILPKIDDSTNVEEGMPSIEKGIPPIEEKIPPDGIEEKMPPAGIEEKMPLPPEIPQEQEVLSISEENPFEGKTIKDVLNVLEPLAQSLSEREFIHSLSKADMILDNLNIASHFPELAEAQAKALELNLYVLTRLKTIINKLKGGLKGSEKSKKNKTPSIEMEELITPKSEKEIFEVEEPIQGK